MLVGKQMVFIRIGVPAVNFNSAKFLFYQFSNDAHPSIISAYLHLHRIFHQGNPSYLQWRKNGP